MTVSPANAPTNFSGTPNAQAKPELTWTPSTDLGNGSLLSMQIERMVTGGSVWNTIATTSQTSPPYTDTTANLSTSYDYRIASINEAGIGAYSSTITVVAGVPPDAPTGVSTSINNPDPSPLEIQVSWTTPTYTGTGTLTGYTIQLNGNNVDAVGLVTTASITAPSSGSYDVTVKAVSSHGNSVASSVSTIQTPVEPPAPTLTLSIADPDNSPLTITNVFTAPTTNGGSAITGYNLYYSVDDTTYSSVTSPYTVSSAGTHYFKGETVNNVGAGVLSSAFSIATPTIPPSPTNANSVFTNIDSTPYSVTVSWDLPTSTGGSALTGYNLYRQTGTGAFTLITTTTALSYIDTVPTALNQDYTWKVTALNNVGESTAFVTTTITTGDVPDAPVLSFTTGTTALSWTTPASDASITGYEIFRDSVSLTTVTGNSHSDFTPINFGQSYQYEVQAVSSLGNSADSNSIVTTPETEITGMIVQGITGTGAVIDWNEPAYYQGQITSYSVYYSTPFKPT